MKSIRKFWAFIGSGFLYLVTIYLVIFGSASSEVVYKTIGEDGIPMFSDKIKGEPERLVLPKGNSANALETPQAGVLAIKEKATEKIYKVEILSPPIDYTFRNSEKVAVEINVRPRLASGSGHEIRVFLDGNLLSEYGSAMNFKISDLDRGTHTLEAVLTDIAGQELARSNARTFFVQKTSISNRNRLNN